MPPINSMMSHHTAHHAHAETATPVRTSRLDSIARMLLIALFTLLPFFFFPVTWLSSLQSKILIASAILGATAILWLVARIREGSGKLPWSMLFGASALLPIVYALSAAVNGFGSVALVGSGIEPDTLAIICLEFSALALVAMVFGGAARNTTGAIRGLFAGILALQVIHIIHVIFPSLSLGGVLAVETGNAMGTWHEFTMFMGFALITSIALCRSSLASGYWRWVVVAVGLLSVPILLVNNFADVWIAVGVAAVVLLVVRAYHGRTSIVSSFAGIDWGVLGLAALFAAYFALIAYYPTLYPASFSRMILIGLIIVPLVLIAIRWYQSRTSHSSNRPEWVLICVLYLALVGIFAGAQIVGQLPERISVVQVEVRPSWQGTFQIGEQSLSNPKAFIFGVGPNSFIRQWGLHKPIEVNQTPFWNADFNVGVAPIPTSFISTGILGALAWLLFIVSILWSAIGLWIRRTDTVISSRVLAISVGAVYLLAFQLSSVPGTSLGLMMFLVLGLLTSMLMPATGAERHFKLAGGDAKNAVKIAAAAIIVLVALIASIGVFRAVLADATINRAIVSYNTNQDLQKSSDLIATSLKIQPSNDRAHRAAVELGLLKLQQLINAKDPDQEAAKTQLQTTLEDTIKHGLEAVQIDGSDYQNWLQLAALYSQLAGAQIQGAYDNARAAYVRAQQENPTSPLPLLNLGQLDALQGNLDSALENLGKAVALKPDLASAYYLASQIYVAKSDANNALIAAAQAARYAPNDPLAWYNAGAIAYAGGDYPDASIAMQQALALQPQYANAMYVLGLSLYQLKDPANAILVFEALNKLDPNQPVVNQILTNLKGGKPLDTPLPGTGTTPADPTKTPKK